MKTLNPCLFTGLDLSKYRGSYAFSLIELLISLITISLIVAAFTPTLIKKLNKSNITLKAGDSITTKCEKFSASCNLCTSEFCILCTQTCPSNQFKDDLTCKCASCETKFANCTQCNQSICLSCKSGYILKNGRCEICKAGTYSPGGTTAACMNCGAGQYSNADGMASCLNCPSGQVSMNAANLSCITCSNGYFASNDSGVAVSLGGTKCSTCLADYYCTSGKLNSCGVGKFSTAGSSSAANCISCNPAFGNKCSACTNANGCTVCTNGNRIISYAGKNYCFVDIGTSDLTYNSVPYNTAGKDLTQARITLKLLNTGKKTTLLNSNKSDADCGMSDSCCWRNAGAGIGFYCNHHGTKDVCASLGKQMITAEDMNFTGIAAGIIQAYATTSGLCSNETTCPYIEKCIDTPAGVKKCRPGSFFLYTNDIDNAYGPYVHVLSSLIIDPRSRYNGSTVDGMYLARAVRCKAN